MSRKWNFDGQMTAGQPIYFFTEPWEPVSVRRGDALGMGALADQFANAVAPDFSNRIIDGRWVTLLAWSLVHSHELFKAAGGRSLVTRQEQTQRYAWLRPLELMWVARTLAVLNAESDDRKQPQLNGRKSVGPWIQGHKKSDRFGMTPKQFQSYRQSGLYGGYRRAFRMWPGLTVGDGWTPGQKSKELSRWLDSKLKVAQLKLPGDLRQSAKRALNKEGRAGESKWWLKHWQNFDQAGKDAVPNTLPRPRDCFSKLPEAELLKPIIFGADEGGQQREKIARYIAKSRAVDHASLYEELSQRFSSHTTIHCMAAFSCLEDAGLAAMDYINDVLGDDGPNVPLADLAKGDKAKKICKALQKAAQTWLGLGSKSSSIPHADSANRFACSMAACAKPVDCFRQLLVHHESYGGGLRWFVLRDTRVEARTLPGAAAKRFDFRLWALCRLAVQCGVLRKMPNVFLVNEQDDDDD